MDENNTVLLHMIGYLTEDQWADGFKHFGHTDDFEELLKIFDNQCKTNVYDKLYNPEVE